MTLIREKTDELGNKMLFHCHFLQHQAHVDWTGVGRKPHRSEADN